MNYHLAVDIGASSGRHIIGWIENGIINTKEVYRFENKNENVNGTLVWDTDKMFNNILNGIKECKKVGLVPTTMSIDTWGVDFVLLDKDGKKIGDAVGYRDSRTDKIPEKVFNKISKERLYEITGIQHQKYNTIFQIASIADSNPEDLANAEDFLMIPDYFVYLLTGNKFNEYTNASTTELLNCKTNTWDEEILDKVGINKKIFKSLSMPGTVAGNLQDSIKAEVGYDLKVILAASHDTASAVMAVPSNEENVMYISSGTWSLMGVETQIANCDKNSAECNFTNEGGYNYRYRFLKNIMGLWMIQSVKRELNNQYSFDQLCDMATENKDFPTIVDVLDARFLAPKSMIEEIKLFAADHNLAVPESIGELIAVVYNSLAKGYTDCANQLEQITGKKYSVINIVGGGSKDSYLNQITANYSGRKVEAGPSEATAIGNLINQMLAEKEIEDLSEARNIIKNSFAVKVYNCQ